MHSLTNNYSYSEKLCIPASPGRSAQGTEDSNAIVLDVRAKDFERLLWVFYNPYVSSPPSAAVNPYSFAAQ